MSNELKSIHDAIINHVSTQFGDKVENVSSYSRSYKNRAATSFYLETPIIERAEKQLGDGKWYAECNFIGLVSMQNKGSDVELEARLLAIEIALSISSLRIASITDPIILNSISDESYSTEHGQATYEVLAIDFSCVVGFGEASFIDNEEIAINQPQDLEINSENI